MTNENLNKLAQINKLTKRADQLFNSKQYEAAYKLYQGLFTQLNKLPKIPTNHNQMLAYYQAQMGLCFKQQGNLNGAIKQLNEALTYNLSFVDINYELALLHFKLENFSAAKKNANQVINYSERYYVSIYGRTLEQLKESSHHLLGNIFEQANNLQEATKHYQAAKSYIDLAKLAIGKQDYKDAEKQAKLSVKFHPSKKSGYYYLAMSIIEPIKDKFKTPSNLNKEETGKIGKAIGFLEQTLKITDEEFKNDKDILFFLACLYDLRTSWRNPARAVELYELAKKLDDPRAIYNLACKYEAGEDVPLDKEAAFKHYSRAAELGEKEAYSELGRCYLTGMGCELDYNKSKAWLMEAADNPLAQYHLAILLMDEAIMAIDKRTDVPNNLGLFDDKKLKKAPLVNLETVDLSLDQRKHLLEQGKKIFALLNEADKANINSATLNLALLFHKGFFVNQDFIKAREYYLKSIKLGNDDAKNFLLELSYNLLCSANVGDANYKQAESDCRQILKDYFELDTTDEEKKEIMQMAEQIIDVKKSVEIYNSFDIDEKFKAVYESEELTAEDKVDRLLTEFEPKKTGANNLAINLNRLVNLLEKCSINLNIFKKYQHKINSLLISCKSKLINKAFTLHTLCNLTTTLCKLFYHGYLAIMDDLLKILYQTLNEKISKFTVTNFTIVISAVCFLNLKANLITKDLQSIVDAFSIKYQEYIKSNKNLASVFYSLAILDNYSKMHSDFKLTLPHDLIKSLLIYAINKAENPLSLIKDKRTYILSILYFSHNYPQLVQDDLVQRFEKLLDAPDLDIQHFLNAQTHKDIIIDEADTLIKSPLNEFKDALSTLLVSRKQKPEKQADRENRYNFHSAQSSPPSVPTQELKRGGPN